MSTKNCLSKICGICANCKIEKYDHRNKIKCKFGKICFKNPCPYLHNSKHVPYVKPEGDKNVMITCRYDNNCYNCKCKFKHSNGYIPHPLVRCKMSDKCVYKQCNFSHPNDEWWDSIPIILEQDHVDLCGYKSSDIDDIDDDESDDSFIFCKTKCSDNFIMPSHCSCRPPLFCGYCH